jgi:hypothetical protein
MKNVRFGRAMILMLRERASAIPMPGGRQSNSRAWCCSISVREPALDAPNALFDQRQRKL